jgi:hypothetical protein
MSGACAEQNFPTIGLLSPAEKRQSALSVVLGKAMFHPCIMLGIEVNRVIGLCDNDSSLATIFVPAAV